MHLESKIPVIFMIKAQQEIKSIFHPVKRQSHAANHSHPKPRQQQQQQMISWCLGGSKLGSD